MTEYQLNTGKWSEVGSWGTPGKPSNLVAGDVISILGDAELDEDITIPFGVSLRIVTVNYQPATTAIITGNVTLGGTLVMAVGDFTESYMVVTTGTFIFAQGSLWTIVAPEYSAGSIIIEEAGSLVIDSNITMSSFCNLFSRGFVLCTSNSRLILSPNYSSVSLESGYFIQHGLVFFSVGGNASSYVSFCGDCKYIVYRSDKVLKNGYGSDPVSYGDVIDFTNAYGLPTNDMIGG